jgi:hypothetical protein
MRFVNRSWQVQESPCCSYSLGSTDLLSHVRVLTFHGPRHFLDFDCIGLVTGTQKFATMKQNLQGDIFSKNDRIGPVGMLPLLFDLRYSTDTLRTETLNVTSRT